MNNSTARHTSLSQTEQKALARATRLAGLLTKQLTLADGQLSRTTLLKHLPTSTRRLKGTGEFLGQKRAFEAIETALKLPFDGYNIFAAGTPGLGKRTMIMRLLAKHAATMPTPPDWVYVNHFENQRMPLAIALKAGEGLKLKEAIHKLWKNVFSALEKKFATSSYQNQIETIRGQAAQSQQSELKALTEHGKTLALKLVLMNEEHHFVPYTTVTEDGQTVEKELMQSDVAKLPAKDRQRIHHNMNLMDKKLSRLGLKLNEIEEAARYQVHLLNQTIARDIITPRVKPISKQFAHHGEVLKYLARYANDIIDHVDLIIEQEDPEFLPSNFDRVPARYQVNVMANNNPNSGAPVIFEDLPSFFNLIGHIEQQTHMGTITTDFTLIRHGSLHRANGGFLILEASQLLEQPYAWHGLKRALQAKQIRISSLEHMLTLNGNISLEPAVIPLNIKVILIGDAGIYYEMLELEPEFNSIFKIRADFCDQLSRTPDNEMAYVHLIADYVNKKKLRHLDRSALALLLADSSRKAEDQQMLSLHAASLGDLLVEANVLAETEQADLINQSHITQTLSARQYRLGYLRELYWRHIEQGDQLISTSGARIGQVNGLTVLHYADSEFGLPVRITATVAQGSGEVLDIERTVDLGGSIHAKGVLIMSSFLKAHFGRNQSLHFSASVAFEQNYSDIDGDSASLAELTAIISAISQIPVSQAWAITGSMNQLGEVQPIGGVNEKIEGFFKTCQLHGLSGTQGVIIPQQNIKHLMLDSDIIAAVRAGQFRICAVQTIDQALSILLGRHAGELDNKQQYPAQTVYAQVAQQLKVWHASEEGLETAKPKARGRQRSGHAQAAGEK